METAAEFRQLILKKYQEQSAHIGDVLKGLRKAQLKMSSATKQRRCQPKLLSECFQNILCMFELLSCVLRS